MSDKNFPLVSIITVTRNLIDAGRKDFFRQCVESVRMQDYPSIEHLIIDGASTDGTVELLQELGVNYVSEPDTGVYNAFNKGIKKARGKYIAFLNSDDFYTRSDTVSLSVAALEKSQADFSYASIRVIDEEKGTEKDVEPHWGNCFIGLPFCHQTMFSTKKMMTELGGFDENFRIIADFDLFQKALLANYRAIEVKNTIAAFRLDGLSSLSGRLKAENIRVIETNCGVSHKQAVRAVQYGFLPKKTLLALLNKTTDFPDQSGLLKKNKKQFFKYLRKQFLTFRIRKKGKRCIRLLGITFYDEGKL